MEFINDKNDKNSLIDNILFKFLENSKDKIKYNENKMIECMGYLNSKKTNKIKEFAYIISNLIDNNEFEILINLLNYMDNSDIFNINYLLLDIYNIRYSENKSYIKKVTNEQLEMIVIIYISCISNCISESNYIFSGDIEEFVENFKNIDTITNFINKIIYDYKLKIKNNFTKNYEFQRIINNNITLDDIQKTYNNNNNMKLYVLEGCHAVGKSTMLNLLKKNEIVIIEERYYDLDRFELDTVLHQYDWLLQWVDSVLKCHKDGLKKVISDRGPISPLIYGNDGFTHIVDEIFAILKKKDIIVINLHLINPELEEHTRRIIERSGKLKDIELENLEKIRSRYDDFCKDYIKISSLDDLNKLIK